MITFQSLMRDEKARFLLALSDQAETDKAARAAATLLERVGQTYLAQEMGDVRRSAAHALVQTGRAALLSIQAASEVEIWRREPTLSDAPMPKGGRVLPWLPTILCAALGCWQVLDRQPLMAALLFAAALLALLPQASRKKAPAALTGIARVSPDALWTYLDRLSVEMDRAMESTAPETSADAAHTGALSLTKPLLESIQVLLEAEATGDGAYALRALPALLDALRRAGVEAHPYSPAHAEWFAFYPSLKGGQTIRPALAHGEDLLLRGQATEETV